MPYFIDYIRDYRVWAVLAVLAIIVIILVLILKTPFRYPYFIYYFDVSGKRKPQMEDLIDQFLIDGNMDMINQHNEQILNWKKNCMNKIEKSKLKNYRLKQYDRCLDDSYAYVFSLTRDQTRYKQKNYVRTAYKVTQIVKDFECDYLYLLNRDEQLKEINYECTLREYYSKNQRKLMTKELRREIILRDNYTCQICGKYMPDEVGLHVDHIIPISKGGKTVPSNLQVLCSKCNGSKSNKI